MRVCTGGRNGEKLFTQERGKQNSSLKLAPKLRLWILCSGTSPGALGTPEFVMCPRVRFRPGVRDSGPGPSS